MKGEHLAWKRDELGNDVFCVLLRAEILGSRSLRSVRAHVLVLSPSIICRPWHPQGAPDNSWHRGTQAAAGPEPPVGTPRIPERCLRGFKGKSKQLPSLKPAVPLTQISAPFGGCQFQRGATPHWPVRAEPPPGSWKEPCPLCWAQHQGTEHSHARHVASACDASSRFIEVSFLGQGVYAFYRVIEKAKLLSNKAKPISSSTDSP